MKLKYKMLSILCWTILFIMKKKVIIHKHYNLSHSASGHNTDEELGPENYPRPINGQPGCPYSQLPQLHETTPLSWVRQMILVVILVILKSFRFQVWKILVLVLVFLLKVGFGFGFSFKSWFWFWFFF